MTFTVPIGQAGAVSWTPNVLLCLNSTLGDVLPTLMLFPQIEKPNDVALASTFCTNITNDTPPLAGMRGLERYVACGAAGAYTVTVTGPAVWLPTVTDTPTSPADNDDGTLTTRSTSPLAVVIADATEPAVPPNATAAEAVKEPCTTNLPFEESKKPLDIASPADDTNVPEDTIEAGAFRRLTVTV